MENFVWVSFVVVAFNLRKESKGSKFWFGKQKLKKKVLELKIFTFY